MRLSRGTHSVTREKTDSSSVTQKRLQNLHSTEDFNVIESRLTFYWSFTLEPLEKTASDWVLTSRHNTTTYITDKYLSISISVLFISPPHPKCHTHKSE